MSSGAGITLQSVSKHYETEAGLVRAVEDLDLELEPGTSLAVTGPSGCGKSTLLGLIAGLEPPSSGRVSLGGREISSMPESERVSLRRDELGLVFQSDNLLPFLTAIENVRLQLAMRGSPNGYDRCASLLRELGLEEELEKLPDQLSGGQRQRVAVAGAIVHEPRLILADEPTGSLDADNSTAVLELLLTVQRQSGASLVVVTHDKSVAARLDRTVSLRDGRLASA